MTTSIDQGKLDMFLNRFVADIGAAMHGATVLLGEKLGLYKALARGPCTPAELADRTGTEERYVREWLAAQAASDYCEFDASTGRFQLSPEQAFALTVEHGPAYIPGAFYVAAALFKGVPKLEAAFRTGEGVGWHEQDPDLFVGTEKFFRPGYTANLVSNWLPALQDVMDRLDSGVHVADVGCGHGVTTILMAQSFPASTFVGFDFHPASIERARALAAEAGLNGGRLRFEVADSRDFPGRDYGFVTFFDCLHDMGDPSAAAAHVHDVLDEDGTWMIVEPFAQDSFQANLGPVGRLFYSASTAICCPVSMSQDGRAALGAQAGEARLREIVEGAGFRSFRRATETPFNLVLEARK